MEIDRREPVRLGESTQWIRIRAANAGVKPGAWTAGQLFGAALVADATGAQVTVNGQPA